MMRGSLHPLGQTGPCRCGSGRRLVDCCLQENAWRALPVRLRDALRRVLPRRSAGLGHRAAPRRGAARHLTMEL
jgi:hypothetical protein